MATNPNVGKRRVATVPVNRGTRVVQKFAVLEFQNDLGERAISPFFDTEKQARQWWEKSLKKPG